MTTRLPKRSRIYETEWWSSARWDHFLPRHGDIIIATPAKTGTTWVQTILLHLIFPGDRKPVLRDVSPWLDTKKEEVIRSLDEQSHRRFIKTHTPLDGLPYWPEVTYLVVGRDGRDVFMSAFHHYNSDGEQTITLQEYWQKWIADDELACVPQAPLLSDRNGRLRYLCHFFRTFWDYRHLENIRFVHFNDLLANSPMEIQRIADITAIEVTEKAAAAVAEAVTFSNVKKNAVSFYGKNPRFKGGVSSFINKGTNGRWKAALSDNDIKAYLAIVEDALSPECAHWLEHGRCSVDVE